MAAKCRKILTLEQKVKALEMYNKKPSSRKVAEAFGVSKDQIQNLVKRKSEVLEEYNGDTPKDSRIQRRKTGNEGINELTWKWYQDAAKRGIRISGPMIQRQALKFAAELKIYTFHASNGWLQSFIKRNNIHIRTGNGERGDVLDKTAINDWITELPAVCEGYEARDIFNMHETGLVYCVPQSATCSVKIEEASRLTVALCASMSGEKMKPVVIGRASQRRCLKNVDVNSLPVQYHSNSNAWMTSSIFKEWILAFDKNMKLQKRNVLLFVDDSPSHISVMTTNVKLVFWLTNTTSICQPMDQGIIRAMKLKFREKQLKYIINQMMKDSRSSGDEILRTISVLDTIYWIGKAWESVEPLTIQNCFARAGFAHVEHVENSLTNASEDDEIPLAMLRLSEDLFGCEFQELPFLDSHIETSQPRIDWNCSAVELLANSASGNTDNDSHSTASELEESQTPPSLDRVQECLEELKAYALHAGNAAFLKQVMELQDISIQIRMTSSMKLTNSSSKPQMEPVCDVEYKPVIFPFKDDSTGS